jgi:DNA polymerase III subunit gamma/tau
MLGTISRDHVVRILDLLAAADSAGLLRCAQSLEEFAPDYAQVLDELAALLVRVGFRQAVKDYEGDELYEPQLLERLAQALSPEDVQLYYQTAILGRRDLALAPEPRSGFEMTLLRMLAFRPAGVPAGASGQGGEARAAARALPPQGKESAATPAAREQVPPSATAVAAGDPGAWTQILSQIELGGAARQLASHCAYLGRQGNVVRLALDPQYQVVRSPAQEDKLAQALSRHFGASVRLEFQAAAGAAETPAQAQRRAAEQELAQARRAFETDPGVQGLRERFGATVLPETVRPVK